MEKTKNIIQFPLHCSVPFKNEFLGEGQWVQLGNAACDPIMLMPYNTQEHTELVSHVMTLWNARANKYYLPFTPTEETGS